MYVPTYFLDMYHYIVSNLCIQNFLFDLCTYVRVYFVRGGKWRELHIGCINFLQTRRTFYKFEGFCRPSECSILQRKKKITVFGKSLTMSKKDEGDRNTIFLIFCMTIWHFLKGPKREIFGAGIFTEIRPVWVGDLETRPKNLKSLCLGPYITLSCLGFLF